jgi:hypothetical protein
VSVDADAASIATCVARTAKQVMSLIYDALHELGAAYYGDKLGQRHTPGLGAAGASVEDAQRWREPVQDSVTSPYER